MSAHSSTKVTTSRKPGPSAIGAIKTSTSSKVRPKDCECNGRRKAIADPATVARCNGLRYVMDDVPGFKRRKQGKSFRYLDTHGKAIKDSEILDRIRALVIPPAWADVWISPYPDSHLQVTGIDARGRKQYRYHEKWREVRDQSKYEKMVTFSQCLPKLRQQVQEDLKRPGLEREKVLATVVRLLEATCIRVGNETYARDNDSYGLTTMRGHHVDVTDCQIRFDFRGKSGKDHNITLQDCALAEIVQKCKATPGDLLFQYVDDAGESRRVTSNDVNRYLRQISGRSVSAKDFRTWWGTVLTALALREQELPKSPTGAKRTISAVIKQVAAHLGNTPTVCRKCYIHPVILEAYTEGRVLGRIVRGGTQTVGASAGLLPEEKAVVRFLKQEWQRG